MIPAPGRAARRTLEDWLGPLAVFAAVALVYTATADRTDVTTDVWGSSTVSWMIGTHGTPFLDDFDFTQVPERLAGHLWIGESETGHTVMSRSPGVIASGVPLYWLHGLVTQSDGVSMAPQALTAALLSALAVALMYAFLRRMISRPTALAAIGIYAFATPMWSVAGDALWTHPVTVLGIAGMLWAAHRDRWLLVGIFGGVGLWGRVHVALIVAIIGLGVAYSRRSPRVAARVALTSGSLLGLASLWTHWMYGRWFPSGGYDVGGYAENAVETRGVIESIVLHTGMWLSPDRGILVWTPILLLMLPALLRSWSGLPDFVRWAAVGGVVYTGVQAQFGAFHGGAGFYGYRHGLELLTCLVPAMALSAPRMGRWARALFGPVVGLQLAAITLGAVSEGFLVLQADVWRDNSLALALRHFPMLWGYLALMVLVGYLAGRVWRERGLGEEGPSGRVGLDRDVVAAD